MLAKRQNMVGLKEKSNRKTANRQSLHFGCERTNEISPKACLDANACTASATTMLAAFSGSGVGEHDSRDAAQQLDLRAGG